jgi:hypothetical protein
VAGVGEAGEPVQLEGREKLQGEEILKTEAFNLVARNERLKLNVFRSATGIWWSNVYIFSSF